MTKVDIISGFLGAGKTTFIKELIEKVFAGEKLVLIENEFGEIGIDGGFLQDAGIEITEMNSGCICCSVVGDFREALKNYSCRWKESENVPGQLWRVFREPGRACIDNRNQQNSEYDRREDRGLCTSFKREE